MGFQDSQAWDQEKREEGRCATPPCHHAGRVWRRGERRAEGPGRAQPRGRPTGARAAKAEHTISKHAGWEDIGPATLLSKA